MEIVLLLLKVFGFIRGIMKGKEESHKWMVETAELLHEKNLLTARHLVEMEKRQSDYIDKKIKQMKAREKNGIDSHRKSQD